MSKKPDDKNEDFDLPMDDFEANGDEIESIGDEEPTPIKKEACANVSEDQLKELEKYKSDYLYLKAEFDNFKRRSIKERSDLIKYGSEPFVMELLSVLDVFDMALENDVTAENIDSFKQGMEMTQVQMKQSLEKFNILEIGKTGDTFDPNIHEALSNEPTAEVSEGCISRVFKKGYKFHDRVIRPAQVVVATKPQESSGEGE